MGRFDEQIKPQPTGRFQGTIEKSPVEIIPEKKEKGFIRSAPSNIKALFTGKVPVRDIAEEVPEVVKTGVIKAAETFTPAIKNFFEVTGGILGEGLAYAVDKNVREQFKAGNLDVLPTISETSQADLARDVFAAGIETAVYRSMPNLMKKKIGTRLGVGALEGIGFAISEGIANDSTPEEILKEAQVLGVAGSVIATVAPYLTPLLKAELKTAPREIKELFKGIQREVTQKGRVGPGVKELPVKTAVADETVVPIKKPDEVIPPTKIEGEERITKVDRDVLPVQVEGDLKVSRLEARVKEVLDDVPANKAEEAGLTTFNEMNKRAQITQATKFVEKDFDEALAVLRGERPAPKGLLHNSIALAAEQKAVQAADKNLVLKLASLRSTRAGQEISILTEADPSNPISKIHEIIKARTESATRKLKSGKTLKSSVAKNVKESSEVLSKSQLKISEAEDLLKSIIC